MTLCDLLDERTVGPGGPDVRRDHSGFSRSVRHTKAEVEVCPAAVGVRPGQQRPPQHYVSLADQVPDALDVPDEEPVTDLAHHQPQSRRF